MSTRQHIITSTAAVLSVAAIAAPSAAAMPPFPVGPIPASGQTGQDHSARYVTNPATGRPVAADVVSAYSRQDKRMITPQTSTPQPVASVKPANGFDWTEAAIIAAAALALALLALGSTIALSRSRARRPALSH